MDKDLMAILAPIPPKRPLLPPLSARSSLALLCQVLYREGYNDHIAGHITWRQADDTLLANPWELAWDELGHEDILTLDAQGKVLSGGWNITPAINLHTEIYNRRPDVKVIIHNHSRYGTVGPTPAALPPFTIRPRLRLMVRFRCWMSTMRRSMTKVRVPVAPSCLGTTSGHCWLITGSLS